MSVCTFVIFFVNGVDLLIRVRFSFVYGFHLFTKDFDFSVTLLNFGLLNFEFSIVRIFALVKLVDFGFDFAESFGFFDVSFEVGDLFDCLV